MPGASRRRSARKRGSPSRFAAGASKRVKPATEAVIRAGTPGPALRALRDPRASHLQLARDVLDTVEEEEAPKGALTARGPAGLLLEACGCVEALYEQFLEGLEFEQGGLKLEETHVEELCKEAASKEECFCEAYPILAWKGFAEGFEKFWELLVQEATLKQLGVNDRVEDFDMTLFGLLAQLLSKLSEAPLKSFRHTAVAAAVGLANGALSRFTAERSSVSKSFRQLASVRGSDKATEEIEKAIEAKFLSANVNFTSELDMTSFEEFCRSWKTEHNPKDIPSASTELLNTCITHCFAMCQLQQIGSTLSFIWKVRVHDIHEEVRLSALDLGLACAVQDPINHLHGFRKHVEELFFDKSSQVRAQACLAFAKAVSAEAPVEDLDEEVAATVSKTVLEKQKQWSKRVEGKLEQLLFVASPLVVTASIEALRVAHSLEKLGRDLQDKVEQCFCYVEEERVSFAPVRQKAAQFVLEARDGIRRGDIETPSSTSKVKKNNSSAQAVARARLQLSAFVKFLSRLAENRTASRREEEDMINDDDGADDESNPSSSGEGSKKLPTLGSEILEPLINAFWDLPSCEFLRNWEAICNVLQTYGENEIKDGTEEFRARCLAELLLAAVFVAERAMEPNKKSSKKVQAEQQQRKNDCFENLHNVLRKSLSDMLTTFKSESDVLKSLVPLCAFIDVKMCSQDADRLMLIRVEKLLGSLLLLHSQPQTLVDVARELLRLVHAEDHPAGEQAKSELNETVSRLEQDLLADIADLSNNSEIGDARSEARISLSHGLRRIGALRRIQPRLASFQAVMFIKLCNVLEGFATDVKENEAVIADGLVLLQLDLFFGFDELQRETENLSQTKINDLLEKRASFEKLLKHVLLPVHVAQPSVNLKRSAIASYGEVRTLFTPRLASTELRKLVWTPEAQLQEAVFKSVGEESDQEDRLFQRFVVAPLLQSLVGSTFLVSAELKLAKEFLSKDTESSGLLLERLQFANPAGLLRVRFQQLRETHESSPASNEAVNLAKQFVKEILGRQRTCPARLVPYVAGLVANGIRHSLSGDTGSRLVFLSVLLPFARTLRKSDLPMLRKVWTDKVRESMTAKFARTLLGSAEDNSLRASRKAFKDFESVLGVKTEAKKGDEESAPQTKLAENEKVLEREENLSEGSPNRKRKAKEKTSEEASEQPSKKAKPDLISEKSDESAKEIEKNLFSQSDNEMEENEMTTAQDSLFQGEGQGHAKEQEQEEEEEEEEEEEQAEAIRVRRGRPKKR